VKILSDFKRLAVTPYERARDVDLIAISEFSVIANRRLEVHRANLAAAETV
jgi:hypothetical protein